MNAARESASSDPVADGPADGGSRASWARARIRGLARRPRLFAALLAGGAAITLGGVAGAALFAGFVIGERDVFPAALLAKAHNKIDRTLFPNPAPERLTSKTYPSHLIKLEADVGVVGTERDLPFHTTAGNGGGLTSFGSDVVLLPYSGRLYAASSSGDIRPTEIYAPDNNRAAYVAAAEDPRFADLDIRDGYLRYNDIEYFENGDARGFLVSYIEYHPEEACYTNTLARLDVAPEARSIDAIAAKPEDWRVLYRTRPCLPFKNKHYALEGHMAGGRLAFEAPTSLYMTSGDFHFDGMRSDPGPGIAQDPDAEYGKILEIDIDTGESRVLSGGHRNPQGIAVTPEGEIYSVEHGPRGGDELNLIREGANYGWPLESFGVTYDSNAQIPGSYSHGRHELLEAPVYSWVPSAAISAITYVEGFHPSWEGDLLVGSLIDESLHRLRMDDGRVVYSERIEIGSRLRDVHEHTDGRLVLWTDNQELIFLNPVEYSNMAELFEHFVVAHDISGRMAGRLETALGRCAECHAFEPGDHQKSPSLGRIFGDEIASTSYDGYSDALKDRGGTWTHETLSAFLRAPHDFAPGTSMPDPGLEDDDVIEALVAYLEHVDQSF